MKAVIVAVLRWALVRVALVEARLYHLVGGITAVATLVPKLSRPQLIPVLRRYGATVGKACDLCSTIRIHNPKRDFANLTIGDHVHLGPDTFLDLTGPIEIGDRATISMRCTILTHIDVGASPLEGLGFPPKAEAVFIGSGVYLGANCTVLMGTRIGREAVIGAGSLVRGEIECRVVAVGNPARVARLVGPPAS